MDGKSEALGCSAWRWIGPDSIHHFAFSKADRMPILALESIRQMP
ncbi:MAG: hypothetical protein ACMUIM_04615 [bacterium]